MDKEGIGFTDQNQLSTLGYISIIVVFRDLAIVSLYNHIIYCIVQMDVLMHDSLTGQAVYN